jgi:hypothetical protein
MIIIRNIFFRTHEISFSCLNFFESLILHLRRNVTKGGDNEALVVGELAGPEPSGKLVDS